MELHALRRCNLRRQPPLSSLTRGSRPRFATRPALLLPSSVGRASTGRRGAVWSVHGFCVQVIGLIVNKGKRSGRRPRFLPLEIAADALAVAAAPRLCTSGGARCAAVV